MGGIEPLHTKSRIADWPAWYLWLAPESIGTTREEADAATRNEITPARLAEIQANSKAAFFALRDCLPASTAVQ